jgi:Flp pilus assembly protein CpaB
VVGGFLVAVALVGTFAAYTSATHDTRVGYLVAAHDLTVGDRIGAQDLTFAKMQLPAGRNHAFRNPQTLIGATVVGPIAQGELIQTSEVVDKASAATEREVSIPIDPARAVGGHLIAGDLVDVAATFGTGEGAYSLYVVRRAKVLESRANKGTLGSSQGLVVTLALPSGTDALAVAHAMTAGQITLVRSTGTSPDTGGSDTYRAPSSKATPSPPSSQKAGG